MAPALPRPGGLLLVTVPASPSLWGSQDVISHHLRRYTARTLRDTFARAGLPRPVVSHLNTLLFPPAAAVRWVRRATGAAERARTDFEDNWPGLVNDLLPAVFASETELVGALERHRASRWEQGRGSCVREDSVNFPRLSFLL